MAAGGRFGERFKMRAARPFWSRRDCFDLSLVEFWVLDLMEFALIMKCDLVWVWWILSWSRKAWRSDGQVSSGRLEAFGVPCHGFSCCRQRECHGQSSVSQRTSPQNQKCHGHSHSMAHYKIKNQKHLHATGSEPKHKKCAQYFGETEEGFPSTLLLFFLVCWLGP